MSFTPRYLYKLLICNVLVTPALVGPPLTIEDPDILDPGQWEVILAAGYEKTKTGRSYDLPVLDVSYGVSDSV